MLSRCHDERTAELLMKHGKVDTTDVLTFLRNEDAAFCIHCEAEGDFFGGVGADDEWWTAADWFVWHLEEVHGKWMQMTALAMQIALVARASGSPPLTFE